MLQIKTTGVEDYLDGSANIKALIIGGPGAGKTRMSSFWPKPIYLDCENSRGSLVDRKMPYVDVKSSKDMLDSLSFLKNLERIPKAQRQYQTVVVDTVDSFQRIVKDEWLAQTGEGTFSGYDAWGYLDTKMNLLLTRILNLDYNVITLVHWKDKIVKNKDGSEYREYGLQLQGAAGTTIFNDFGLIGWLGTYWDAGEEGREQRRGLTFRPTPEKEFLKDRFGVTPKWLPISLTSETDYTQLFEAFFNRPEFEALEESTVVGEVPDSEKQENAPVTGGPVAPPVEGGPLPERAPVELALDKQSKEQLIETAKGLGLTVKGNSLKSEIVAMIEAKRAGTEVAAPKPKAGGRGTFDAVVAQQQLNEKFAADAQAESTPRNVETTPTSGGNEPVDTQTGEILTPEQVAERLGGEVIAEEKADTPATPQPATPPTTVSTPNAPQGPSACAECGGDLAAEWADPSKKDYVRLSFVKFRKYLCTGCYTNAIK